MNVTFFCCAVYKFGKEFIQDYKAHKKDLEAAHLEDEQNNTHVVPINNGDNLVEKVDDPEDDNNDEPDSETTTKTKKRSLKHSLSTANEVDALHDQFHSHELALQAEHKERQLKQRRKTQNRVLARLKIRKTKALTKVPMFKKIPRDAIESILELTTYEKHTKGEVICTQNDVATEFYIIVSGSCTVNVLRESSNVTRKVGTLKDLDFFGENALLDGERKRNATVIANSEYVQVLLLSRTNFNMLMDSGALSEDVMKTVQKESERRELVTRESFDIPKPPSLPSTETGTLL